MPERHLRGGRVIFLWMAIAAPVVMLLKRIARRRGVRYPRWLDE
jgi:hypothetical protein